MREKVLLNAKLRERYFLFIITVVGLKPELPIDCGYVILKKGDTFEPALKTSSKSMQEFSQRK